MMLFNEKLNVIDIIFNFLYILHKQVSHVFENYGKGLRWISFTHEGRDRSFWAGNYGSKMAGACVCIKVPPFQYSYNDESDTQDE